MRPGILRDAYTVKLFAVICFLAGVSALGTLVVRRNQQKPWASFDMVLTFAGLAGAIIGLLLLFNRMQ
jgi:GTP-sensing pleiotropic transcriptional regulator CodY